MRGSKNDEKLNNELRSQSEKNNETIERLQNEISDLRRRSEENRRPSSGECKSVVTIDFTCHI